MVVKGQTILVSMSALFGSSHISNLFKDARDMLIPTQRLKGIFCTEEDCEAVLYGQEASQAPPFCIVVLNQNRVRDVRNNPYNHRLSDKYRHKYDED